MVAELPESRVDANTCSAELRAHQPWQGCSRCRPCSMNAQCRTECNAQTTDCSVLRAYLSELELRRLEVVAVLGVDGFHIRKTNVTSKCKRASGESRNQRAQPPVFHRLAETPRKRVFNHNVPQESGFSNSCERIWNHVVLDFSNSVDAMIYLLAIAQLDTVETVYDPTSFSHFPQGSLPDMTASPWLRAQATKLSDSLSWSVKFNFPCRALAQNTVQPCHVLPTPRLPSQGIANQRVPLHHEQQITSNNLPPTTSHFQYTICGSICWSLLP